MEYRPIDLYIHTYYNDLEIRWEPEKSERLKASRGFSFEDILEWRLVAVQEHPVRAHQSIIFLLHEGAVWCVPCVVNRMEVFLKTAFRSRKHTRMWVRGELK